MKRKKNLGASKTETKRPAVTKIPVKRLEKKDLEEVDGGCRDERPIWN